MTQIQQKNNGKLESFILDKWASFPDHLILVVEKPIHYVPCKVFHVLAVDFCKVFVLYTMYIVKKTSLSQKSDKTPFIFISNISYVLKCFFSGQVQKHKDYNEIFCTLNGKADKLL